jgi:hypothetical protein
MMQTKRFLRAGTPCMVVVGLICASASAAPFEINKIAGNVTQTPIYSTGPSQWDMPNAQITNANVEGPLPTDFLFVEPSGFFTPGFVSWTGNPLVADTSAGGLASATFGPGGTLSITGTVYDVTFTPLFTGTLLSGTVSGFSVFEPAGGGDFLDIDSGDFPIFTPVSGPLVDGTVASMSLPFELRFTIAGAQQGGGPLEDFQTGVQAISSFQFQMNAIPEPGSILLLALGLGCCVRGGRR